MPLTATPIRRPVRWWLVGLLLLAAGWRAVMALALPCMARDGVTFCWYARELGQQGLAYLITPAAQQHPLFPALILGVQRIALLLGASDTPLTWQRSGQVVCWLAGLCVVVLSGAMAGRLVRRLALPLDEQRTALLAMLLAALLPLNVWLSADVMSDQVHLAFYLAAVWLMLKLDTLPAALGCGVLGGLAFLTRQEGLVIPVAGLAALVAARRHVVVGRLAIRAGVLLLGFLIVAGSYWGVTGRFSQKKDPFEWIEESGEAMIVPSRTGIVATAEHPPPYQGGVGGGSESWCAANLTPLWSPLRGGMVSGYGADAPRLGATMLAKLRTHDLSWYGLLPYALYALFRAGRVVIPLLAILPLVNLRRRLAQPALAGLVTCGVLHVALTVVLLQRYGYLSVRHMLVPTALLTPFAAMLLARLLQLALEPGRRVLGGVLVLVCVLPLALYSLRVPNEQDRHLMHAVRWLQSHDQDLGAQRLLCGSGPKRIAFYTGLRWEPWFEDADAHAILARQISAGGPGYLAIELGRGFERAGNRELVERLRADPQLAPQLGAVYRQPIRDAGELLLIELHPQNP